MRCAACLLCGSCAGDFRQEGAIETGDIFQQQCLSQEVFACAREPAGIVPDTPFSVSLCLQSAGCREDVKRILENRTSGEMQRFAELQCSFAGDLSGALN